MKPIQSPSLKLRIRFLFFVLLAFVLTACSEDTAVPEIGPRPSDDLQVVVEAYLQAYQPGPLPRLFQTTYLYDRNGDLMAELYSEGRRTWVPLSRISPFLLEATVATEDSTFFINKGIDPIRIAGAAVQNAESGGIVSGASTITMQLARNLFLGTDDRYDQDFDRKIIEAGLARELTDAYSKEEILEMYLNTINYGNLAYGPEAAAQIYFGKSAADLSQAEATLLAGLPQQPYLLNPFLNFEAARDRQQIVLSLLVRHGYLTQEAADDVYAQPLFLNPNPNPIAVKAPHFVNYVISELDSRFGTGYTRRAGMHVYTTLDLQIQAVAQEIVTRQIARLQPTYNMNNGALVAMKPGSAEILAMVGSIDYTNDAVDGQVNVTTRQRQPGSAIKPILYATALSDNLISPATVLWDAPVRYKIAGQPDYEPKNYDRKFHGPVTARVALANSYNIPAVKLLDQVGIERMLESAQNMGLRSLDRGPDWYGLSLTLGGGEVTLLDLTTAYHTIANQGSYLAPRPILAMSDAAGRSMSEELGLRPGVQVLTSAAAFLLTDIMSDNEARTPMFGANNRLTLSRPVAAKTGTTDDNRDNWTMGFTRYLVAGAWVGNTQGNPMRGSATGASTAAVIWNEFMSTMLDNPDLLARIDAPSDPEQWEFQPSPDVTLQSECPEGLTCRRGGGEYFANDWLAVSQYSGGPLSDSVITAPSLSVFRGNQRIGYCLADRGVVRTLVRLPARLGLPSTIDLSISEENVGDKQASIAADITLSSPNRLAELELPDVIDLAANARQLDTDKQDERRRALSYSGQVRGQVSLGPCDEVQSWLGSVSIASGEIGQSEALLLVEPGEVAPTALSSSATQAVETATPEVVETPVPTVTPTAEEPTPEPRNSSRYRLVSLTHDNNCPGSYVLGRIVNSSGGPVAGVRVRMIDGWGNYYEAMSKSGAADFGMFDFPLYSDSPQDLQLTVLDSNGNPISATVTVPHNQSEESKVLCHFVVIQGN